jgi:hypothetical protein
LKLFNFAVQQKFLSGTKFVFRVNIP